MTAPEQHGGWAEPAVDLGREREVWQAQMQNAEAVLAEELRLLRSAEMGQRAATSAVSAHTLAVEAARRTVDMVRRFDPTAPAEDDEPLRGDVQAGAPPGNPSWLGGPGRPDPRLVGLMNEMLAAFITARFHPAPGEPGWSTTQVLARAACIWLANEIDAGTVTARGDYFAGLRDTASRVLRLGGVE